MHYVITVQGSRVTSGYMLATAGERDRQTHRETQRNRQRERQTYRQRRGAGGNLFRFKNSHYRCILVDNLSPEGNIIYFHLSYF